MFKEFTKINKDTKIRILMSWKGRSIMESNQKYRKESLNTIYSNFCNLIHDKNLKTSTLELRLQLIKILNIDKPLLIRAQNFLMNIFSKSFGISEVNTEKIIISWSVRNKLEENKNFIYSERIKTIYEHLSNILHGQIDKHDLNYIKCCREEVIEFFNKLGILYTHKLYGRQTIINLKDIKSFRKKKILSDKKAKRAKILFFKSPSGKRIAFIENNPVTIKIFKSEKFIILTHKSKDIGVFEFVDMTNYYTFIRAKKVKSDKHYSLYYHSPH